MSLYITKAGHVYADRIKVKIFSSIERGDLNQVNGIVVHQTNSPTASATFNSYANTGANGAHFLIDKDGTIIRLRRSTSARITSESSNLVV